MSKPRITFITPTLNRDYRIIERCARSVTNQTVADWEHIICSDGQFEPHVEHLVRALNDPRRRYAHLTTPAGHFGAGVRQAMISHANGDHLAFLDDDNMVFPKFAEHMIAALDRNPDAGFAICQMVQTAALPPQKVLAPTIITGIPPVVKNIDTLQVVVRKAAMEKSGWCLMGYCSDGHTYEKLAQQYRWIAVDEVLGIKL
jgi:glycosyltransferase involved in cell wall biosynthesis